MNKKLLTTTNSNCNKASLNYTKQENKEKRRGSLKDTSVTYESIDWENKNKQTSKQKTLTRTKTKIVTLH